MTRRGILAAGSADMLLLKLMECEDMYGYQIIEQLRARSENLFEMKAGTLYPLLHSLVEKGYLTCYERAAGESRTRKYYHLTEAGRGYLSRREQEWHTFARAMAGVMGGAEYVLV